MSEVAAAKPASPPEPKRPFHKNPFLWGFLIGAFFLTVLPLLQRQMMRAPPPLGWLPSLSLDTAQGPVALAGSVWIVSVATAPCSRLCMLRQEKLERLLPHVEDLKDKVKVLTLAPAGAALSPKVGQRANWVAAEGASAAPLIDALYAALFASTGDAGPTIADFAEKPLFWLLDQEGAIRGFWGVDELSQGNVINAARLLAREGPNP